MEVITYNKIGYPVKTAEHLGNTFKVARVDLFEAISYSDGEVKRDAEWIDEQITYYCQPEEYVLSDEELYNLVYAEIDLFEHYEILPEEVQELLLNSGMENGLSYEECAEFVTRLETFGYTCEYGLDACPINLRKL